MNGRVQIVLALILFLPWFSILGFVFWRFPRQPRTRARIVFDLVSLLLATGLGLTVLGEGDARRRAMAAAAIVVGITLLALG